VSSTTVTPIVLSGENQKDKLKEITDRLEKGVREVFESERYKTYLKVLSRFHEYSYNNCILIALQNPEATQVAGFTVWRDQFGRNVKKGEKGIKIIAPTVYKAARSQERKDPNSGKPVLGADGKPETDEVEYTVQSFHISTVFDVSQTEGRPLPQLGVDELTGDVDRFKDIFAAIERISPVPISFEDIPGESKGFYHQEEKRIVIREGMSELQTIKTALHELAHSRLHDRDRNAAAGTPLPPREVREQQAEAIAFTCCESLNLDTSDYSFAYVASWGEKDLGALKASLNLIRSESHAIITELDSQMKEIERSREARNELATRLHDFIRDYDPYGYADNRDDNETAQEIIAKFDRQLEFAVGGIPRQPASDAGGG